VALEKKKRRTLGRQSKGKRNFLRGTMRLPRLRQDRMGLGRERTEGDRKKDSYNFEPGTKKGQKKEKSNIAEMPSAEHAL